jgi:hypothetical protein
VPGGGQPDSTDQFEKELEEQHRELEKMLEDAEKEAARRRQELEEQLSPSEEPLSNTQPLDDGIEEPPL